MKAHIAMQAAEDDEFRARLVAGPHATLEAETGLRFSADYRLHVHEESATDAHLVLPPKPDLSREQLDHIAGGKNGLLVAGLTTGRGRVADGFPSPC